MGSRSGSGTTCGGSRASCASPASPPASPAATPPPTASGRCASAPSARRCRRGGLPASPAPRSV
eukprot:SM005669S18738  [mRNA]  locus=s5669:568:756:+ [translate_table: standard]